MNSNNIYLVSPSFIQVGNFGALSGLGGLGNLGNLASLGNLGGLANLGNLGNTQAAQAAQAQAQAIAVQAFQQQLLRSMYNYRILFIFQLSLLKTY